MDENETPPPSKRPVVFKSKKQMKEEWAKLDLPDLEKTKVPSEEHSATTKCITTISTAWETSNNFLLF